MDINENPYLMPENFLSGYEESMKQNKESGVIEFDALCYNVFMMNEDGKKLLELFKERFIFPATPGNASSNYDQACIYYEGYREAFRGLILAVQSYQLRKDSEAKLHMEDKKG